jgi:hypothetical protein
MQALDVNACIRRGPAVRCPRAQQRARTKKLNEE